MPSTHIIDTFHLNADFVSCLHDLGARFLIVGGAAVHVYVPTRAFDDLDIMIDPTLSNAELVMRAIQGSSLRCDFTAIDLALPAKHIPLKQFHYLDLLTPKEGFDFNSMLASAHDAYVRHAAGLVPVKIASAETLVALATYSELCKHKADIALLRQSTRTE